MPVLIDGVLTYREPIQHRRGTTAYIESSNYIPAAGEIVVATDTGRLKAGNGINALKDLPYADGKSSTQLEELKQQLQDITARVERIEESSEIDMDEVFDEILLGKQSDDTDSNP